MKSSVEHKAIVVESQSGNLVLNYTGSNKEYRRTQKGLVLNPTYIEKFNLVSGDEVAIDYGRPYEQIKVISKL